MKLLKLWDDLSEMQRKSFGAWLMLGAHEKYGGNALLSSS